MSKELLDYMMALHAITAFEDIAHLAASNLESYGIEWLTYGIELKSTHGKSNVLFFNNYDHEYMDLYKSKNHITHDFGVIQCMTQETPFYMGIEFEPADLSPEGRNVCEYAADAGIYSGYVMPLRGVKGRLKGGIGIASSMKRDAFAKFMAAHETWVQLMLMCTNGHAQHLVFTPQVTTALSDRQRDILLYAARGLKNAVIAEKIGVSEQRIYQILAKTYQQLGVVRRIDAVATALRMGLIDP